MVCEDGSCKMVPFSALLLLFLDTYGGRVVDYGVRLDSFLLIKLARMIGRWRNELN